MTPQPDFTPCLCLPIYRFGFCLHIHNVMKCRLTVAIANIYTQRVAFELLDRVFVFIEERCIGSCVFYVYLRDYRYGLHVLHNERLNE